MKSRKNTLRPLADTISPKGFFRVQIEENGKICGDSGWYKNTVTNNGFQNYLCFLLGKQANSKQIGYISLGTGTAPNATHTYLDGEISGSTKRTAVTVAINASKTITFTATFASGGSFLAGQSTLQNIGLFSTTDTSDYLFAGSTYTGSSCNTNQNVNVTYQIQFA